MTCEIEHTDEFGDWFSSLDEAEQVSVTAVVELLRAKGVTLRFPHSSKIMTSRHEHMRELRIQHQGRPIRVLYAFDPRRVAILLIGGDKTGQGRWYEVNVPKADDIYDATMKELQQEGLI